MSQVKQVSRPLRVAAVGPGFWARFQVRAWRALEIQGLAKLVGLCGRNLERLTRFQQSLASPIVPIYTGLEELLGKVPDLDVVDLITPTPTHRALTLQVLEREIPVIVQKPMAQTLSDALAMVEAARDAGVPLLVHEDFRWQKPFMTLKSLIIELAQELGSLVDMRLEWESGGEDFLRGQPYFATQSVLVNGEVGVHLIDLLRFLSGRNVSRITSAHMHRGVDSRYRGEDVAHVTLDLQDGISAAYRVAFSAAHQGERPPQTFARIVFQRGTIELTSDYEVTVTLLDRHVGGGIHRRVEKIVASPDSEPWTQDPSLQDYQSWLGQWESCLSTNRACAEFIRGNLDVAGAVTTGEDNLNVLAAVFGAYLASRKDIRVAIPHTFAGLRELAAELDAARIGYPEFPDRTV
jgi:predicted dehydrogenase